MVLLSLLLMFILLLTTVGYFLFNSWCQMENLFSVRVATDSGNESVEVQTL